jgi:hypothetical protein
MQLDDSSVTEKDFSDIAGAAKLGLSGAPFSN